MQDKILPIAAHVRDARWIDLAEGQCVEGVIVRLPAPGVPYGTRLFIRRDDGQVVSLAAAARRGWSVFENALKGVLVGDRIYVKFDGWRQTADGERRYRNIRVTVLERPVGRAA
jgi:hypothetical protein